MYCILGLCFLCKPVCVLEAGMGMSSGEEEKRLLGSAGAVGRRQCEEGATHSSRGQVTKDAAGGEHRNLGCSSFLGGMSHQARTQGTVGCMGKVWDSDPLSL